MFILPICSCCSIRIIISLDLEVIEHDGYLLIGLAQEQIGAVRVRRIVGGVARTV